MSHAHKVHTDTVEPTSIIDAIEADLASLFMASSSESFDLPAALQDRPSLRGYGLDVCKLHSNMTAFDRSHGLVLLYTTPKYLSSGQEDPSHSVVKLMDATSCWHTALDQCCRDKSSLDILFPGLPKGTILVDATCDVGENIGESKSHMVGNSDTSVATKLGLLMLSRMSDKVFSIFLLRLSSSLASLDWNLR